MRTDGSPNPSTLSQSVASAGLTTLTWTEVCTLLSSHVFLCLRARHRFVVAYDDAVCVCDLSHKLRTTYVFVVYINGWLSYCLPLIHSTIIITLLEQPQ